MPEITNRDLSILGSYRPDGSNSMPPFADLLKQAADQAGFHSVKVAEPKVLFGHFKRPRTLARITAWVDKYLAAPLSFPRSDILHIADHGNALYLPHLKRRLAIVTCHDLIPWLCLVGRLEGWRPSRLGTKLLARILDGLKETDCIVCVSENTRKDLIEIAGIDCSRAIVINNCLRPDFPRHGRGEAARILTTMGIEPDRPLVLAFGKSFYKNRYGSLEMFARASPQLPSSSVLVSVGPADDMFANRTRALGLADRVLAPDRISQSELAALYTHARALLFPSLYEGFGWPVIEAQSFGVPVVASKTGPLPEVARDGAILIDPRDVDDGANALVSIFCDDELRNGLIRRGKANLRRFSFDTWAQAHRALYAALAAGRAPAECQSIIGSTPQFLHQSV